MSPWRPSVLRPRRRVAWGLDARQLAWRGAGNARAEAAPHAEALPQALQHLSAVGTLDVIAGNDLALHWLQSPPRSIASLEELKRVAAVRCTQLYGGSTLDWWVSGDWSAGEPFMCAALPAAVIAPLQQALAASGVGVHWHTAWSAACAREARSCPADGWSALRTPTRLMLWHCSKRRVDCLSTQVTAPDASSDEIAQQVLQQIRMETLRSTGLTGGAVHWITLPERGASGPSEAGTALVLGESLSGQAQ